MSDHMLEIDFDGTKWCTPRIVPYHNLSLDPAASVFHYGTGGTAIRVVRDAKCFEGMKAYRDNDGHIRMFRPRENVLRMNSSIERLCLPVGCGCRRLSVARRSGCAPGGHQGVGARG